MKASELAILLAEWSPDMEVYVMTEDGILHDFRMEERDDVFDGFDTVYEGGLNIIISD